MSTDAPLPSWNDGVARQQIVQFVQQVTDHAGPAYVLPADRVAVFDTEPILATVAQLGWTVVSMRDHFTTVSATNRP